VHNGEVLFVLSHTSFPILSDKFPRNVALNAEFKYTVYFDSTGHLQVYNLVSHCRPL
jgi:hypothetical protein